MNIEEALDQIAELQKGLSVDGGEFGLFTVPHAYSFQPSGRQGRIEVPCWLNEWAFSRQTQMNSARTMYYTVTCSLLLEQVGSDTGPWGRIGARFHQAFCDAFMRAVMLRNSDAFQNLRGSGGGGAGEGTFKAIEFNGLPHYGLEYLMDLQLHDVIEAYP